MHDQTTYIRFFETQLPRNGSNVVKVDHDARDEIIPMNLTDKPDKGIVLQGVVVTRPS